MYLLKRTNLFIIRKKSAKKFADFFLYLHAGQLFIIKLKTMKKLFRNLLVALSVAALISGCFGPCVKTITPTEPILGGPIMKTSYTMMATSYQVDSICAADTLPSLDKWNGTSFNDYETNEVVIKRLYIKRSGNAEIMYTVTGQNEPFAVSVRITK